MKKLLLLSCLLISITCIAQKQKRAYKGSDRKFAAFTNMLSLLEPQQAAVGAGINYTINRKWHVSLELNYLFDGFVQSADDYNSTGYRVIATVKRFTRTGVFFYGADARIKYFSYIDRQNFINTATSDTLFNVSHNASTTMTGGAGIVGIRLPISKNKRWAIEINTGVGVKYRNVERKNIPAGYAYYQDKSKKSRHPNIADGQDIDGVGPYLPSALRIMFFF